MESEQTRLKQIQQMLKDSEDCPKEILLEMDAVILKFEEKMRQQYQVYIVQNRGVTTVDYENYKVSLHQCITEFYPWIDQSTYKMLYGRLSYR
jgi:hypothetical protein